MFQYFKAKWNVWARSGAAAGKGDKPEEFTRLSSSIIDNMVYFEGRFNGCADFIQREIQVFGKKAELMMIDNMADKLSLTQGVLDPLTTAKAPDGLNDEEKFNWIRDCLLAFIDQREIFNLEECEWFIMSGFVCLLIDGYDRALVFGLQDFKFRSIEQPNTGEVLRGSREGFVEPLRINLSLLRRRVKNSNLKFENYQIGEESKTEVSIIYIKGIASETALETVRQQLMNVDVDTVLESGYLQVYFQENPLSIFSTVGTTQRPDTLCGKLNEGRIGIFVDGSPFVLVTPYLFTENFQNIDDYAVGAYYAAFTRGLKYLAYFISVMLPALYVAVGSFHQMLLPTPLLYTLAQAEEGTPFPLVFEALLMQVIYEILREAGLRAPKQIGSALNIVGAFLIGQAAVAAGLIGAPMVIIVALTATTSLVVPSLYEPGVILRFAFIILAGISGLFGITVGLVIAIVHMCSLKSCGLPYMSPLVPFDRYSMRDVVIRAPWNILSRKKHRIQDLTGSDMSKVSG